MATCFPANQDRAFYKFPLSTVIVIDSKVTSGHCFIFLEDGLYKIEKEKTSLIPLYISIFAIKTQTNKANDITAQLLDVYSNPSP